jgi:hypothetical protein
MTTHEDKLIKRTIEVIGILKEKRGEKERETVKASVIMNYHRTVLTNNK